MKGFQEGESKYTYLTFRRTREDVLASVTSDLPPGLGLSGAGIWCSNGGAERGHPGRALPYSFDAPLGDLPGRPVRMELMGVFAFFVDRKTEAPGTLGATLQILEGDEVVFRQDLVNGRHYGAAAEETPIYRSNGDGTSIATIGSLEFDGIDYRLERLTIDLPEFPSGSRLIFRDLGSPASFGILDIAIEVDKPAGCPFHSKSGLIPLKEVGAIVRVGDRRRFAKTLDQLQMGILATADLDEARGQALTFLAIVTAAMLEHGGARELHRIQLDTARKLDQLDDLAEIAELAIETCEIVAEPLFSVPDTPSAHLMDKAMAIVDRNYAKDLSDSLLAEQLGLSTSHFRFLFRQATGNPFHKYLVAVRLEKAKQILMEQDLPVSHVASAVGFAGLSHFSRAFTQRFSVSPSAIRKQGS